MVGVAQLVRAPDCGSGGRGFETRHPPHISLHGSVAAPLLEGKQIGRIPFEGMDGCSDFEALSFFKRKPPAIRGFPFLSTTLLR